MKDGFNGKSIGKAIFGLKVVNLKTNEPISFKSSFKRNLPILIPFVPLIVAFQLRKGTRMGDRWASSKVIWEKYKNTEPFMGHSEMTRNE